MIEGIVKSQEEIAEAEVVVAVLFATTVLGHAHPFEPNPTISHQHRQRKIQQAQNRFACTRANPAFVHLSVTRFNACSHARVRHFRRKPIVFIYLRLVFNFLSVSAFVFPAATMFHTSVLRPNNVPW